jgi:hypothetical protein
MYMMVGTAFTVPAHHPDVMLNPPIAYGAGKALQGEVLNGMFEDINVAIVWQGYTVPAAENCWP